MRYYAQRIQASVPWRKGERQKMTSFLCIIHPMRCLRVNMQGICPFRMPSFCCWTLDFTLPHVCRTSPAPFSSGRPQRAAQRPLNRSANERPIYDEFGNLLCTIKIEKLPARRVSRSRSSRLDEPSGSAPQAAGGPSPRHVRSLSFSGALSPYDCYFPAT